MPVAMLTEVTILNRGSAATADVAAGGTVVPVENVTQFDSDGVLDIVGIRYDYTSVDDLASTITLTTPLTVAVTEFDPVSVVAGGEVVRTYSAVIDPGEGDNFSVPIPFGLRAQLAEGVYDPPVPVVVSADQTELLEIPGRAPVLQGIYVDPKTLPLSDGLVPVTPGGWTVTLSPFAIGALEASWAAIENTDPVTYDVYAAAGAPVTVFDGTTLVGSVSSTKLQIRGLPGNTSLLPTTDYYVAVIPRDDDGPSVTTTHAGPTRYRKADVDTISANWVYAGIIEAEQIDSGSITANLAVLGSISTAAIGRRLTLSSDGLYAIDSGGNVVVAIPTDLAADISLNANLIATTLTATGKVSMRAPDNEMVTASALTLQVGTTAPASPLTVQGAPSVQVTANASLGTIPRGSWYSATNKVYLGSANSGTPRTTWSIEERDAITGARTATILSAQAGNIGEMHSVARIGTNYYILYYIITGGSTINWWVQTRTVAAPTVPVGADWAIPTAVTGTQSSMAGIGIDSGTDLLFAWAPASGVPSWATYSPAGAVVTAKVTATGTAIPGTSPTPVAVWKGTADLGASRVLIQFRNFSNGDRLVAAFNPTGARDVNLEWLSRTSIDIASLWHDGAAWKTLEGSSPMSLTVYDGHYWTTGPSGTPLALKATSTWYDGAGTTHETPQSAIAPFALYKRSRILLTAAAIPGAGGADDPDRVRFYIGNSTGTRTTQWLQGTGAPGSTSATITAIVFSGTNPPAANNFPATTPATFQSAALLGGSPTLALKGDGSWRLGNLSGLANGQLDTAAGGLTFGNQPYSATGFVRLTTSAAADAAHPLRGGMTLVSAGLTVPVDGWYMVYGSIAFATGTAGTVARRGIAISQSAAAVASDDPQISAAVANNSSGSLTVSGPVKLAAGAGLYLWGYTDVGSHYSSLNTGRLRAVLQG